MAVVGFDPTAARRLLAAAPVDEHALLEAALAWHQLRPRGNPVQRRLPIAETDRTDVADRLIRLLSGLTWPTATRSGTAPGQPVRIEVAGSAYHRVLRALTCTWRHAQRQFSPGTQPVDGAVDAAAALWRMALLLATGPDRQAVNLRTGTAGVATVLTNAAATLGVTVAVEHTRGCQTVVVHRPADVRRLRTAAHTGQRA